MELQDRLQELDAQGLGVVMGGIGLGGGGGGTDRTRHVLAVALAALTFGVLLAVRRAYADALADTLRHGLRGFFGAPAGTGG